MMLSSNFEMKGKGEANYILGLKIFMDHSKKSEFIIATNLY